MTMACGYTSVYSARPTTDYFSKKCENFISMTGHELARVLPSIRIKHPDYHSFHIDSALPSKMEGFGNQTEYAMAMTLSYNVVLGHIFKDQMTFSESFNHILKNMEVYEDRIVNLNTYASSCKNDTIDTSIYRIDSPYHSLFYSCFIRTFRRVIQAWLYDQAPHRRGLEKGIGRFLDRRHTNILVNPKYVGLDTLPEEMNIEDALIFDVIEFGYGGSGAHGISHGDKDTINLMALSAPIGTETIDILQAFQDFILSANPNYAFDSCPFFLYYTGKISSIDSDQTLS